jgi:hypothetical protein
MNETWKTVPGYDGLYEVSDHGRIRSLDRVVKNGGESAYWRDGKMLSAPVGKTGYRGVQLCREGKRKNVRVHRAVLEAFVGPCPDGMEACHGDGDRLNNHLSNLRWDTRKANHADKSKHGSQSGERNHRSRLTRDGALDIMKRIRHGQTHRSIASDIGMSPAAVSAVASGRTWSHVTGIGLAWPKPEEESVK